MRHVDGDPCRCGKPLARADLTSAWWICVACRREQDRIRSRRYRQRIRQLVPAMTCEEAGALGYARCLVRYGRVALREINRRGGLASAAARKKRGYAAT